MRRAARIDSIQREIVEALRAAGASVISLAPLGHGLGDLLVGVRHTNFLLEVKGPRGRLTRDELDFHLTWRGQIVVVRTVEEALYAIGASAALPAK